MLPMAHKMAVLLYTKLQDNSNNFFLTWLDCIDLLVVFIEVSAQNSPIG